MNDPLRESVWVNSARMTLATTDIPWHWHGNRTAPIPDPAPAQPLSSAARAAESARPLGFETGHALTRKGSQLSVRVIALGEAGAAGYALVFGDAERRPAPLVRIHSRCLYGDALGSDDCDCGPELEQAMDRIQRERAGVLVYLEQEGRGAGLIVKAMGLRLSEQERIDTFASYVRLGHDPDSRSYELVTRFLCEALGLTQVRLLTNNPDKVAALSAKRRDAGHTRAGLRVITVPVHTVPRSRRARRYLEAKRQLRGHTLWSARRWRLAASARWGALAALSGVGTAAICLDMHEVTICSHVITLLALVASNRRSR